MKSCLHSLKGKTNMAINSRPPFPRVETSANHSNMLLIFRYGMVTKMYRIGWGGGGGMSRNLISSFDIAY